MTHTYTHQRFTILRASKYILKKYVYDYVYIKKVGHPVPSLDRPAVLVWVKRRDGHVHAVLTLPLHRPAVRASTTAAAVGVWVVASPATTPAVAVVAAAAAPAVTVPAPPSASAAIAAVVASTAAACID